MGEINKKCQVPTPYEIVVHMLDKVGYTENLFGKRILENSCGAGGFLSEIVHRYIQDCVNHKYSKEQITLGLQRDIHGFEKDRKLHKLCIQNLSRIAEEYGITGVHWNIKRKNALHATPKAKYQFVVGNPPYLAYPELDSKTRTYLRSLFFSCKRGKPDYYFAFIETALNALALDGKMVYLVPGNFMKNLYSNNLRELLLPSLYEIIDYSHHKLFEKVLTSSVIICCDRSKNTSVVRYEDRHYNHTYITPKDRMAGKWIFGRPEQQNRMLFSDFFHASAPVATQLNRAFVVHSWKNLDDQFIEVDKLMIEKTLLRNAAGPKALQKEIAEKIIFPYTYDSQGNLVRYSEEQFRRKFPEGYKYLQNYKSDLEKRKSDKQALWYEYGRSQLLSHLNQPKLLLSSFITGGPRTYILDLQTVPYAGICITAKEGYIVNQAQRIINSQEFMDYVRMIGVCTNGVSYRISPTDINSFQFPRELLEE